MRSMPASMAVARRRTARSQQVEAPTDTNAALHTENAQLEGANAELSASNHRLEQTIKCLQVAVTIMLAVTWGLSVALATVMAGATVQITLSSAAGIFFGVIMTSMAILTFIGR
jgi:hypothetical protein